MRYKRLQKNLYMVFLFIYLLILICKYKNHMASTKERWFLSSTKTLCPFISFEVLKVHFERLLIFIFQRAVCFYS